MTTSPFLTLSDMTVGFGGRPLFHGLDIVLHTRDRVALVGRNGTGKSTLMQVAAGLREADDGERHVKPGTRIAYLAQTPDFEGVETLAGYLAQDLEGGTADHRVARWLEEIRLDGRAPPATLSSGELRRAALARAFIAGPDLLLLDEPTNHLDLPTIEWLEASLDDFAGAVILVSHDRALLTRATRTTLWLDRGTLRRLDKGFAHFEAWSEEILEREAIERRKLDRLIESETRWSHEGITARRKRNRGRLGRLGELRRQRAEQIARIGRAKLSATSERFSGRLVVEAEDITKGFGADPVIDRFSTRIMRGDRVAIIGANGAGKTTLLRMLIGELPPDRGAVRLGTNLDMAYLDQTQARLDPDTTLWDTLLEGGGDHLMVRGQPRHIVSYLRDFLFSEGQARSPVSSLSGGERNRLLLAKILARPANFLVLDEPTNDLDIETLDLLQEMLADFDGTVLFISHDRDFIDRVATSTIAIDIDGRIIEYAGGYGDYLAQRQAVGVAAAPARKRKAGKPVSKQPTRLSYKQQRALDGLPGQIDTLHGEIAGLESTLADPALFARDAAAFNAKAERLNQARGELARAEDKWLELEALREAFETS